MQLINAEQIKENKIKQLQQTISGLNLKPKLTIFQVEGDEASNRYVNNKIKIGEEIGVKVNHVFLPNNITTSQLIELVEIENQSDTHGIIVQLPLPKQIDARTVISHIKPSKDVDGLTNEQFGKLASKDLDALIPCTAKSVMMILDHIITKTSKFDGLNVVIVNRSHLIGLPLSLLLTHSNCTVTLCHSKTKNLKEKMKNADIIITGIGKANYFDKSYFKHGQIVIDCSMNILDGKLVGDVDINSLKDIYGYISSGKKQTGPLTCVSLMENTICSAIKERN